MVMGGEWTIKTITVPLLVRGDLPSCAFFLTCDPNSVDSRLSVGGETLGTDLRRLFAGLFK